jgi:hypothetical protein
MGHLDCYVQEMEGKKFLVHSHREDRYVQKIMSTHGGVARTGSGVSSIIQNPLLTMSLQSTGWMM